MQNLSIKMWSSKVALNLGSKILKIVEEMLEKTMGFNSFEIFVFTL